MPSAWRRAALALAVVLLGGCGSSHTDTDQTGKASRTPSSTTTPSVPTGAEEPAKVLVVIEENHSYAQMRAGMPFLSSLSDRYGYATHWTAISHPSAPNYLAIAGGSTFGVTTDAGPAADEQMVGDAISVFDQAVAAGKTASTYAESMPENCHIYDYPDKSQGTPVYAVRHNPWVYFPSGQENCKAHDIPLPEFAKDVAADALPNLGFLIPDLTHDAHDGSLVEADAWLKEQLSPVLESTDFKYNKLVVIVTADEDDHHSGNTVLTSVLTPSLSHKVVTTPLTHYSLTRFIAQVLGVAPLENGQSAPDMKKAFWE